MQFSRFIATGSPPASQRVTVGEELNRLLYHQACAHALLDSVQLLCGLLLAARLQRRFVPKVTAVTFCSPVLEMFSALAFLGFKLNEAQSKHYGMWYQGSIERASSKQKMNLVLEKHRRKFYTDSQFWH